MERTINSVRNETGLSQSQFAEQFGISVRTLQDWEQGRREMPSYVKDMIALLVAENKANKKLAWYVVDQRNDGKGEIFGTDVPYISKVQAIKEAKGQWFHLTDKEKKERTITVCLMDFETMETYDEINADTIE